MLEHTWEPINAPGFTHGCAHCGAIAGFVGSPAPLEGGLCRPRVRAAIKAAFIEGWEMRGDNPSDWVEDDWHCSDTWAALVGDNA